MQNKYNLVEEHKRNFIACALFFSLAFLYRLTNIKVADPIDLSTFLDQYIKLVPPSIVIYHVWYPSLYVIMYFMRDDKQLIEYITALFLTKYLCVLTYIFLPSVVSIRQDIVPHDFFEKLVSITYALDPPYNGFPSSHCACAAVAYFYSNNRGRWGYIFQILMIAIIISTMTTMQHIIIDCIGGIFYAYVVITFIMPKIKPATVQLGDILIFDKRRGVVPLQV